MLKFELLLHINIVVVSLCHLYIINLQYVLNQHRNIQKLLEKSAGLSETPHLQPIRAVFSFRAEVALARLNRCRGRTEALFSLFCLKPEQQIIKSSHG